MKSVQIRSFLRFLFSYIQSEYEKLRTIKNSVFGYFSRSDCFLGRFLFSSEQLHLWFLDVFQFFISPLLPPPPRPKTRDVVPRSETRTGLRNSHCVKIIQIRSYYWSIFSHIRSKYGPEKTPYLDTFRSLRINWIKIVNIVLSYDRGVFRIQSDQGC